MRALVGTFHRPYTKASTVSTPGPFPGARDHTHGLGDALLGVDEGVLVLDRDRVQAAVLAKRADKVPPPGRVVATADDAEVPRHRFGCPRTTNSAIPDP